MASSKASEFFLEWPTHIGGWR